MTAILDKYGRILIPKKIRKAMGLKENVALQIRQEGNQLIIEPLINENLYVEKDGYLVYTGDVNVETLDWLEQERSSRDRKILGI